MLDINCRWREQQLGEVTSTHRFVPQVLHFMNVVGKCCDNVELGGCVLVNLAFKPDHLWRKLPQRKGISGVSFMGGAMWILFRRERKSLLNCTLIL